MQIFNKVNIKSNLYCFFLSIMFLLICTKSSPLYPFNDWVDSNAFFTMGKGMMNGKVLYRDLFEQKGPLLYFIHGISYLISNKTFLGVFIFEVFSFSVFLSYCNKLISLFLNIKYSLISLPLIAAVILNLYNFSHGDSAEEYCLPLLMISLYYLVKYFKSIYPEPVSYKWLFLNGIIAGCGLWIKYNLLGFWAGWMLVMFICMIINKRYLRAMIGSLVFICGMFVATIPWILYFGINNAIIPWIDTYLSANLRFYSTGMGLLSRVWFVLINIFGNTIYNLIFGFICCVGLFFMLFSKKYLNNPAKISLIVCGLLLAFGVYAGGRSYPYYFLIFSPFIVFGFIAILDLLVTKHDALFTKNISIIVIILSLTISLPVSLLFNQNTYMMKMVKENLVQYKFAAIINQEPNATLLNYGHVDMGFYTTTGIIPSIKFFQRQNIDYRQYPLNIDEQNRYIKEKEIEYVVLREILKDWRDLDVPFLFDNYELVNQQEQFYEGDYYNFFLFKRK